MQERLYTISTLADTLDVSRQTIYNWLQSGRFPNAFEVEQGDGVIKLVPASDVEVVRREEAEKLIERLARLGFQAVAA